MSRTKSYIDRIEESPTTQPREASYLLPHTTEAGTEYTGTIPSRELCWAERLDAFILEKMYRAFLHLATKNPSTQYIDNNFIPYVVNTIMRDLYRVTDTVNPAHFRPEKRQFLSEIFEVEAKISAHGTEDKTDPIELGVGEVSSEDNQIHYSKDGIRHTIPVLDLGKRGLLKVYKGHDKLLYKVEVGHVFLLSPNIDIKKALIKAYVREITIDVYDRAIRKTLSAYTTVAEVPKYQEILEHHMLRAFQLFQKKNERNIDDIKPEELEMESSMTASSFDPLAFAGFKKFFANILLLASCQYNQLAVAKYAIERCGASTRTLNKSNKSPLVIALESSRNNSHLPLVQYLMDNSDLSRHAFKKQLKQITSGKKFKDVNGNTFADIVKKRIKSINRRSSKTADDIPLLAAGGAGSLFTVEQQSFQKRKRLLIRKKPLSIRVISARVSKERRLLEAKASANTSFQAKIITSKELSKRKNYRE